MFLFFMIGNVHLKVHQMEATRIVLNYTEAATSVI